MKNANPKLDSYFNRAKRWQEELKKLRAICLDCQLTEELKWRHPCYTYQKNNIVILQGFKDFCYLMFFKGALLKDPDGILEKPGENSRIARRVPFTSAKEIGKREAVLKAYIQEAIAAEKAGLKVDLKTAKTSPVPEELQSKFAEVPALKKAFQALTPGRQRAYILYFSAAKQAKTRAARVEKWMQQILDGKGLDDS